MAFAGLTKPEKVAKIPWGYIGAMKGYVGVISRVLAVRLQRTPGATKATQLLVDRRLLLSMIPGCIGVTGGQGVGGRCTL